MRRNHLSPDTLENALRQSAPALGHADATRVGRACGRLAGLRPPEAARLRPHPVAKSFLRIAAGLIVAGSALLLLKSTAPRPSGEMPHLVSVPYFSELDTWAGNPTAPDALANESANLVSDLATLTAVLNERSLCILF